VTTTYVAIVDSDLRAHLIAMVIAISVTFTGLFVLFAASYVVDEEICLDRKPPWGPPESGSDPECAGHWYESQHKP
jgi:hypothetical protein